MIEFIKESGISTIVTLTPRKLKGDADISLIKEKIGENICLIGDVDQVNVIKFKIQIPNIIIYCSLCI